MRIVKKPEERRNEILDAAEILFDTKGYAQTTINDILDQLHIAKGTFYHYFKAKDELMEAIVDRYMDTGMAAVTAVAEAPDLTAVEKLRAIIDSPQPPAGRKERMVEEFHHAGNAEMHLRSLVETVRRLAPVLGGIVEQGVQEGVFSTPYPNEVIELLLTASQFLLDTGIFPWTGEELIRRARAFSHVMEASLGAQPGAFAYVYMRYEKIAAGSAGDGA